MEIGKRFLEKKSKYKELDGISAKEYLEKARAMFHEMNLQWDLDELDKVKNEMPHHASLRIEKKPNSALSAEKN